MQAEEAEALLTTAATCKDEGDLKALGFRPLTFGFANIVFEVEKGGWDLVVKKYTNLILLRIDEDALGRCDVLAGEAGIGPKVWYSSSRGLVMERIKGVELQEADMHAQNFRLLDSVAKAIASVHKLSVPRACEGEPMLWRTISRMLKVCGEAPEMMPPGFPGCDEIHLEVNRARFALERHTPKLVLAHGDFKPSNVMRHGDRISIIDFELGGPNYRGFDLMKVFRTRGDRSEASMRRFLRTYAAEVGEPTDEQSVSRLLAETIMFEPLTWLEAAIFFLTLPLYKPDTTERWHQLAQERWSRWEEKRHLLLFEGVAA